MTPVASLFNGLTPSESYILSLLLFYLQTALCVVLSCYPVYFLPITFIPQTSLGLVFLPRDPAVLLFVIPSLWFLLGLHRIKPLCQLFLRSRRCFSLSHLGSDLSWSHCSRKVLLFSRSLQTSDCLSHSRFISLRPYVKIPHLNSSQLVSRAQLRSPSYHARGK